MTIEDRLTRIEAMLAVLVQGQQEREWYTVEEFAHIVGRSEFTCRQWCRLGRIEANKKASGRGGTCRLGDFPHRTRTLPARRASTPQTELSQPNFLVPSLLT